METAKTSLQVLDPRRIATAEPTREEFIDRVQTMRLPYLRFSLTPDCNANCSFCHNEGQGRGLKNQTETQPSYLSQGQIEYIAEFFAPHFQEVKFTGGEPTLVDNLTDIVEIFSDRGYVSSLTTNGFYLDMELQVKLKKAGLARVNVSLSTIDPSQHAEFFGARDQLGNVLNNLGHLSKIFDDTKINFMASPQTVPSQLMPISELSAQLGITVSALDLVNPRSVRSPSHIQVLEHLGREIGVENVTTLPGRFFVKKIYELRNGARWEIDDFRRPEYRSDAFNNEYCSGCSVRDRCVEGPYSLRVGYDGTVRTCLIRKDNVIRLGENGFIFSEEGR